ncbi:MAG: hypothetical protein ABS46_11695 [Cytophagaceae bacterium SCN 52-12]|nr:MAG: hypothetical protein ABS46_11695 [Cytophagaceae bacterium SCN 52-12]
MTYNIVKLADTEFYTEGPVIDRHGNFFFTTLTGGQVMTLRSETAGSVWAEGNCPNGQVIMGNGEHWICESRTGRISAYRPDGSFRATIIDGVCAGVPFTTPNDLVTDSKGNLYFTDSIRETGKVFFSGADGRQELIDGCVDYANGLALSNSEDILYVAESYGNRILSFHFREDGAGRNILIDLPSHPSGDPLKSLPDGLAVDIDGRIWVAHYGMQAIQVVSPEGFLLHTIDTGLPLTSNLAFITDTPAKKELLVTGGYGEPGPGAVLLMTVGF